MDLWGRERDRAERRSARHTHRVQVVIAATGVVALLVTILFFILEHGDGNGAASKEPVDRSAAKQLASASIVLAQTPNNAVVPRAASSLGTPPDYVPDVGQQESHCEEWHAWLQRQGAAILSPKRIKLSSPAETASTITDVRVRVYRRFAPSDLTLVSCLYGAGGEEPSYLAVDLDRPATPAVLTTTNIRTGRQREIRIPEGFFSVAAGRTETIALQPSGRDGFFYEWGVELTITVDQQRRSHRIGTPDRPLRTWYGELPAGVDYDLDARRWVGRP